MKRFVPWLASLGALCSGLFNSGCLVVSSNHVSKPIAPKETVERLADKNGQVQDAFVHHLHVPELDMDVAVHNETERLQLGFLFWVLPIPYSKSGSPDALIQVNVRPVGSDVMFDPWKILFIPAPGAPDAPAKISRFDDGTWKPITREPLSLHQSETFRIEYSGPCNPDRPFTVSLTGVSGKSEPPTTIDYKRATFFHSGFQLPY